jgi:RNA polymerase subunit RPABC4/transcription elongation factor Spt4
MMNPCQNCGKLNAAASNFCRFCGTKFGYPAPVANNPYDFSPPPRPYAWKTDEFQTQSEARKTAAVDRGTGNDQFKTFDNNYQAAPLAYHQPNHLGQPYRCPHCMNQFAPRIERRISSAGWITFAVLLVFFFPLFWIGLLIKEDVAICPSCNSKVS